MKIITNKFYGLFLILAVALFTGCKPPKEVVIEEQVALQLTVDKRVIRADGLDTLQMSVTNNGISVQEECTFHVVAPETILKDGRFFTSKVGEYELYALYKGKYKSEVIRVEAVALSLILNASSEKIVADGEQEVTLNVSWEGKDITSECALYLLQGEEKTLLDSPRFKTEKAGKYQFQATFRGYTSNIFEVEALPLTLILKGSKNEIKADGIEEVKFNVTTDGKDISSLCQIFLLKGEQETLVENGVFKTNQHGKYKFQAIYKSYRSNVFEVNVTEIIPEKPIELTATTREIPADGKTEAHFSVTQGGEDVTSKCKIYWWGGAVQEPVLLLGTSFKTKRAGEYNFKATMGELVSAEIVVRAIESDLPSEAGVLFVHGVTKDKGWYDVNKKKDGRGPDGLLCWAAACANGLQWWQENYAAAGLSLPNGVPSGVGEKWELKIFEEFMANWTNRGAHPDMGFAWYFSGENRASNCSVCSQPKPNSGAYLKSIYDQLDNTWKDGYTRSVRGYSTWGDNGDKNEDPLKIFSRHIIRALKEGIVVLDINPGFSTAHAITLWGCEYGADGLIRYLYITDSDDLIHTPLVPRRPVLHKFEVAKASNGKRIVGIKGTTYKPFVEIQNYYTLRAFPITK
ncbi:IdeS/Mac family cysteine endopeptidase [Porphyromonas circumdentaria]|uniref:Mac 1 protein n=1 Tax=Porphyromonas circumdentaria TaxID=29524 RepID=A0A1T4NVN4_9PORP|nr:IdeS/Mac family cysteine endopeptidase [Porphyromonas circumdentaria]MBB6276202.1 hypothetical protein [Porphyromonas circumdentaria]SJZ82798.1 Mac 1 protein [Porphyromonas circumdentaria]